MKKQRIITITMDIDMETHRGEMKMVITEDGKEMEAFTVSEALSIATTLGHFEQDLLNTIRDQSVKEEFGL